MSQHKFAAVGGDFPDTCSECACFRESIQHRELLPCPFCGSTDFVLDNLVDEDDYFIHCNGCDVQQIANYPVAEAIDRWNRRTAPRVNPELFRALFRLRCAVEGILPGYALLEEVKSQVDDVLQRAKDIVEIDFDPQTTADYIGIVRKLQTTSGRPAGA